MHLDLDRLEREADVLAKEWQTADPFPHIALEDTLRWSPSDVASFPSVEWDQWNELGDQYQRNKRACDDISVIPEPMAGLIRQLSEPRFLRLLERITGIKQLIPDPYLKGGGLHLSGAGGILAPHTDFHYYRELGLYRRVNVLVYLNEGWTIEDGGNLQLFRKGEQEPTKTVVAKFGTLAAFGTDDRSVHGFPEPVAEGKWRRSVALYYYTSTEAGEFSGDETTHWFDHGSQRGFVRRIRFAVFRLLMNLSRGFSIAAHVANPNQGMGLVRTVLANKRRGR